jgi:PST family polysaccharide transporter
VTPDRPYFDDEVREIRSKLVTGASWMTLLHVAAKLIDLVLLAVLARLLTPAEFGVVAAAYVFIEFARLFVEIGVGATIVQLPGLTR